MKIEPPYAPPLALDPPRLPPSGPRWATQEAADAIGWTLAGLTLAIAFGVLLWWAGDLAWGIVGLVLLVPRFLESLLVLGAIFGVAALSPLMEWVGSVPEIAKYWPLALAVVVPVPLALLVERLFFRR